MGSFSFKAIVFNIFFLCIGVSNMVYSQLEFVNITANSNIDHSHSSVIYMGGGVAFIDYNNDGFDDIFLTGGTQSDKIYKNMGGLKFKDVTEQLRLYTSTKEHSMGVTIGDVNNDGFKDIFVTYGIGETNRLYLNIGGSRFEDITISSGLENFAWSMGASFGDINLDGFIDLYVINWVKDFEALEDAGGSTIGFNHTGFPNNLYLNNGDNTFTEVSDTYNVDNIGCGLAVLFTDYNNDSYPDLYIANDFGQWVVPNTLLVNQFPNNIFEDMSLTSGLNAKIYGMGIAAGDYNRDGLIDYYSTNIGKNVLFKNNGDGSFDDVTIAAGVANELSNDNHTTGWGTVMADLDNDGYEDLLVSNGYVPTAPFIGTAIADPNKMYLNLGDGTFQDVTEETLLGDINISRGVAVSDLDNDGDLDILFTYLNTDIDGKDPSDNILLYENKTNNTNNWVKFKLEGNVSNKDAFNTRVKVFIGQEVFVRELFSSSSHGSQNSSMIHVGLGEYQNIDSIKLTWPGGHTEIFKDLQSNRSYFIKEGIGHVSYLGCTDDNANNYDPEAEVNFGCRINVVTELPTKNKSEVYLFPNPSSTSITINIPEASQIIEVFDINGKIVDSFIPTVRFGNINYDVKSLTVGVYYIKITTTLGGFMSKFIKN